MPSNHHPPPTTTPLPPLPPPRDHAAVLGIDVSKDTLDLCLLQGAQVERKRVANAPKGFAQIWAWLRAQEVSRVLVTMEATGPYSLAIAHAAFAAGHRVAVINPRRILDFARCTGRRNKTDRVDAELIARFAATQPLALWQPLPEAQEVLRALLRRQDHLQKQLHAEERRLEMAADTPALQQSLRRAQRWLQAELARLEKALGQHLKAEPALAAEVDRLQAIPGFGQKTARLLVAEMPRHFHSARSVAAWLGVVPRQWTSGSSVRKGSHIGHAAPSLRSKLYFPALTALRHDPRSKALAERLRAAGKSKMSILLAVLHKLVRTAFALLTTGATYQPTHAVTLSPQCSP